MEEDKNVEATPEEEVVEEEVPTEAPMAQVETEEEEK